MAVLASQTIKLKIIPVSGLRPAFQIILDYHATSTELFTWVDDNMRSRYQVESEYWGPILTFDRDEDAVLFVLKWGCS